MELFIFSSLLLAAATSVSPLSTSSSNGDNGASQTNVTSPFVKVTDVCLNTTRQYSTPAVVFIGTDDNQLQRCLYEDPEKCERFYTAGSKVISLLVVGGYIYVGLEKNILICDLNQAESCEIYQTCDAAVYSLAAANGHLYAGVGSTLLICGLEEINSCKLFHKFESSVSAFMQINEYIYLGVWYDKVMRCSLGSCTHTYTINGGINAFSNSENGFFVATYDAHLWKCVTKSDAIDSCESMKLSIDYAVLDMVLFDGILYMVSLSGDRIYKCQWVKDTKCTKYTKYYGAQSIAFSYETYWMESLYTSEDTTCTWQSVGRCPPYVTYYNAQQRVHLEVHVKIGRLYNSQGILVDTSAADVGHGGPAAIFAMGPDGRILLSNLHKKGLLHTSSFFAGKPVSGAGEMVVKNGVIQEIRACSDHYWADTKLNSQVIKSLRAQGYTEHIASVKCPESKYNQPESNVQ